MTEKDALKEEFLKVGWKYLHSIANTVYCSDRSCLRCRLADILFDLKYGVQEKE
jgi:hypothetical protein